MVRTRSTAAHSFREQHDNLELGQQGLELTRTFDPGLPGQIDNHQRHIYRLPRQIGDSSSHYGRDGDAG